MQQDTTTTYKSPAYYDTSGRSVRDNLILARDFRALAISYETDLAHMSHASATAHHCRSSEAAAIRRCRSIIARRHELAA